MVVFDATVLMLLMRPDAGKPIDPATGQEVTHVQERIAHFVALSGKSRIRIGIPTPVLSEVLVRFGSTAPRWLETIKTFSIFEILPFDELSAIEVALITRFALDSGDKRGGSQGVWSKIKYDRQIAAIARVRKATAIYTDDLGLRHIATMMSIPVVGIADLPMPAETAQGVLPLTSNPEAFGEPSLDEIENARDAENVAQGPQ